MPRRRRSTVPRTVVQSFKKVINYAPASKTTAKQDYTFLFGVDSIAAGQTGPTDVNVPTGSVLKTVVIQASFINLAGAGAFQHVSIQHTRANQTSIAPNVIGGDPQRNQVHRQGLMTMGENQNVDRTYIFKIPAKFQRVREGDQWHFTCIANEVHSSCVQIIYKFYR